MRIRRDARRWCGCSGLSVGQCRSSLRPAFVCVPSWICLDLQFPLSLLSEARAGLEIEATLSEREQTKWRFALNALVTSVVLDGYPPRPRCEILALP
jgi:hypothetical protein